MTYLGALVQVFKWIGYLTWAAISVGGSILFICDIFSDEPEFRYCKEYFVLCIVSLIFMIAYIVYKTSGRS